MKRTVNQWNGVQETLEQKQAELDHQLRRRDSIAIAKSADPMDEIQDASERDLAIQNVDSETSLLRQVRSALRRIEDDGFGVCMDCDTAISPKRIAAVPWASRCIECQDAADREGKTSYDLPDKTLAYSA